MPVDFLPPILGAASIGALIITALVASSARRKMLVWLIGILVTACFPASYVWIYHRTEIGHERTVA